MSFQLKNKMEKNLEQILSEAVRKKKIILTKQKALPLIRLNFLRYHSKYGRKCIYHPTNSGIREYNRLNY